MCIDIVVEIIYINFLYINKEVEILLIDFIRINILI